MEDERKENCYVLFLVSLTLLTQTKEKERIDAATSRVVVVAKR